jgi:hypothetical protein
MSNIHDSRFTRSAAMFVVLTLAIGAVALVGCGGTVESPGGPSGTGESEGAKLAPAAVKTEVLTALKATYTFSPEFVWVVEGAKAGTVVVTGPITDTKTKTKYESVTLAKGADGKWAVTAAK